MKITLKEFFESKEKLYIHCKTYEEAKKLCTVYNNEFYKPMHGEYYLKLSLWNNFKESTVFSNDCGHSNLWFAEKNKSKIYEFKDVIFDDESIKITNKETPMKVIEQELDVSSYDDGFDEDCKSVYYIGKCPICNNEMSIEECDKKPNYCSNCGQKLDWSDCE